jgi:hypothetical protein
MEQEVGYVLKHKLGQSTERIGEGLAKASPHGCFVSAGSPEGASPRWLCVLVTNDMAEHLETWLREQLAGRVAACKAAGIRHGVSPEGE